MGGSKSKSVIDSVQQQITQVAMDTVQDCMVSTDQSQVVTSSNAGWQFGGTTRVSQQTDVKSQCFQNSSKQANLQNDITQIIKNAADASGVGITSVIGASTSVAEAKLRTLIQNNITMTNIQKNYNIIKQQQQVTLINTQSGVQIAKSVDISQGASVFAAATLKAVDSTGILNSLALSIDQQSKATTTNPLDFIANIVGSVTSAISTVWIAIAVAIIAVIGFLAYFVLGPDTSTPTQPQYDDTQYDTQPDNVSSPSSTPIKPPVT
jgi:hypothetical protein